MEEGKETAAHCSGRVIEEKMGICVNNDIPLLTDENFDFDLSLSPASGNEDEVFVGPLGHKEKCIAANIEAKESVEKKSVPASDELLWSPLKGEKFVEIFKEAHLLALRLESEGKNEQTKINQPEEQGNKTTEKFVEDSTSKLKILRDQNIEKSPRAVKRETYCVQDSLACQLPACFQKESDKLLSDDKAHACHTPKNRSPVKMCVSSTKTASSPLTQDQKAKERNTKANGKLPMAKTLSTLGKSNLSMTEKPSLKTTQLKLPGLGLTRKMTTSSLSSISSVNSSLNSSLLLSPIGKDGKSSMSSKASVSGSKPSSSTNRLAKVSSLQAVSTEKSKSQARSASTHKIPSVVSLANSSASATSEAAGSGIERMSSVPDLQKLCQQNKDGSGKKGSLCPKPRARILSVPTCQTKVSMKTGDTPKGTPSLGSTFCGVLGSAMAVSTPVKASEDGIFQNSWFPKRSVSMTPASLKRSGIPTPIRRISGFSAVTPKTAPRKCTALSPHVASVHQSSSFSTKRTLASGSKQTKGSKTQVSSSEDDVFLPPVLPLALNFSPEKNATEVVENKLKEDEVQNQLAEEKQSEVLLVDTGEDKPFPCTLECESRPLIDLSNTPELSKITPLKPVFSEQVKLIDLSSPLITLSPDVNKENVDSPLLKF
ncbi:G2 and S phase-expressed protein 1 [Melanerpes formicivorus]|uniref:G2 and S phase-expressed protein 1 n=1 Tax=Melanerpes formicivorus TaxID=211600 RepID=UPI00358F8D25